MQQEIIEPSKNRGRNKGWDNLKLGNRFKPGQSGNPGGRPKRNAELSALLDEHGPSAVKKLVALMASDDERIALMAAKEVADRAFGKAKPVEDDDKDKRSLTINIVRYTDGDQPPKQLESQGVSIRAVEVSGSGGQEGVSSLPQKVG